VETRDALLPLDHAVDAQIQLEALVHTFSDAKDGPFLTKAQDGVTQAREALDAGQKAVGELRYRRRGLAVSSFFILLVLVGLGLKVRQMSKEPES
jgi:hypothetical protein